MNNYVAAIELYKHLLEKRPNERLQTNLASATIAYAYTSACAIHLANEEKNKKIKITGVIGIVMSIIFLFFSFITTYILAIRT